MTVKQLESTLRNLAHKSLQAAIDRITRNTKTKVRRHRDKKWLPNFDHDHMPKLMSRICLDETTIIATFLSKIKSDILQKNTYSNVYYFQIADYYTKQEWLDKLWSTIKEKKWCMNNNLNQRVIEMSNKVLASQDALWECRYGSNSERHVGAKKLFINVLKHMTQCGIEKSRLLYCRATIVSTSCLGESIDATWFKQQLQPLLTNASQTERYECLHIIIDLFDKKALKLDDISSTTKQWAELIKWLVVRIDIQDAINEIEEWFIMYCKSGMEIDWVVDLVEQKDQASLKKRRDIALMVSDYLVGKNPQPQGDAMSKKCVKFVNNYLNLNWKAVPQGRHRYY